jgi:preprotein translocase subunit SecD
MIGTRIETDYDRANGGTGIEEGADEEASTAPIYNTIMTGAAIEQVGVTRNPVGGSEVAFQLTSEGSAIFADFTTRNVGNVLAIVLDKEIISTPTIQQPITEGSGVITGNFTQESANALAVQLRYGSLPIPLKVSQTRTVGPTLGQDSLQKSILAGAIGLSIVILFMGLYYRLPGLVAILAILSYAVITFALFRYIPVTLTLPGVAGLMLSTGSALDANILIFERLKEELRAGRTLRQAIDLGWQRAWPSIRDSNISTIITCLILFWFGSAYGATFVKGFSLTLMIGVGVSLFTAIIVTRTFLNITMQLIKPTNLTRWFGI